ncbi:hypothetical protein MKW98_005375, partial [Papaver atlanticum]
PPLHSSPRSLQSEKDHRHLSTLQHSCDSAENQSKATLYGFLNPCHGCSFWKLEHLQPERDNSTL